MSEQMNDILEITSWPMVVKNPWKDSMVLSRPTQTQTGGADVDLVDQGQVLVAFGVLDFIDANGIDLTERAMLQSPGDDVFHRVEHLVPASAKALCGFFPRKAARPTG
jgi:hypothetical protein